MRISILFAALGLATALPGTPAKAQSWKVGADSYHLVFKGIDLSTSAGRATALARVERAATKLCDGYRVAADRRTCIADTVAASARRPGGGAIALALAERGQPQLAAR
jgi:UrcA family protein